MMIWFDDFWIEYERRLKINIDWNENDYRIDWMD